VAEVPLQTVMGNLTHEDIKDRLERRQIANDFLRAAYEKVSPPPDNQFMAQFWMRGLQSSLFGFGGPGEEDVILGFLLEQEADEMGIRLSDDAVSKYIIQATTVAGKGLSKADFEQIRNLLPTRPSETEIYNAIRAELRARLAYILAIPREITTPEKYWQDFRKLNVRQQLDIAAVPVSKFTADVADPSPAELEAYFDQHKNLYLDDPARPWRFRRSASRGAFARLILKPTSRKSKKELRRSPTPRSRNITTTTKNNTAIVNSPISLRQRSREHSPAAAMPTRWPPISHLREQERSPSQRVEPKNRPPRKVTRNLTPREPTRRPLLRRPKSPLPKNLLRKSLKNQPAIPDRHACRGNAEFSRRAQSRPRALPAICC
jgi:hypothetical protein